jgi:hypothetical protein
LNITLSSVSGLSDSSIHPKARCKEAMWGAGCFHEAVQ